MLAQPSDGRGSPTGADAGAPEMVAVLEAVDAGIIVTDREGRVRAQNAAAVHVFDGPVQHVRELLGPLGDRDRERDGGGSRERTELQILRQPDRWLELIRYVPDLDSAAADEVGEVLVVRDITRMRRSRGLREAFLGLLSHELRTPVTSIYVASDLLESRLDVLPEPERVELLHDIAEESERLLRLIDDLLVLAHFDEGIDLVREPSLLQHAIPVVVEREQRRWPGVKIELRAGEDLPVVTGDETSVQQVTRNLISNALKYGGGQPVLVDIRASEDEPGAVVRVLDRGPGVSPAEGEALFRPFFRSASTARSSNGAGIGLYVCRRLIEAMGGRMWTRRRSGGGSEFGFWLPRYDLDPDDAAADDAGSGLADAVAGGVTAASQD